MKVKFFTVTQLDPKIFEIHDRIAWVDIDGVEVWRNGEPVSAPPANLIPCGRRWRR